MPFEMDSTISIHAPREGGDVSFYAQEMALASISIHAPREGGDHLEGLQQQGEEIFQSTPPARGATTSSSRTFTTRSYFNPRPPRGGRLIGRRSVLRRLGISIHAPREGGDPRAWPNLPARRYFNPRPPRGGRRQP